MRHIFLLGLGLVSMVALAQNATRKAPIKPVEKVYDISLGVPGVPYTHIPAKQLDSFLRLPVYLQDSLGNAMKATAFEVLYSEWGLYDDSTGRERIMMEYYSMSVLDSVVPEYFRENLVSRAK
jgi:hypothetical protein